MVGLSPSLAFDSPRHSSKGANPKRQFRVRRSVASNATPRVWESPVRVSSVTASKTVGICPTIVGERVAAFLRSRHPVKTAINVAAETGCSADQIEKWIERSSSPSGPALVRLVWTYGPELLAVLPGAPAWLDRAQRDERAREIKAQIEAAQAELAELRARE